MKREGFFEKFGDMEHEKQKELELGEYKVRRVLWVGAEFAEGSPYRKSVEKILPTVTRIPEGIELLMLTPEEAKDEIAEDVSLIIVNNDNGQGTHTFYNIRMNFGHIPTIPILYAARPGEPILPEGNMPMWPSTMISFGISKEINQTDLPRRLGELIVKYQKGVGKR